MLSLGVADDAVVRLYCPTAGSHKLIVGPYQYKEFQIRSPPYLPLDLQARGEPRTQADSVEDWDESC
jgi:hypothetical protein